ncbi:flagellar biosynthetic protein FliO [Microbacterium sp. EST19A]|uniref:flagellar biosynthetic protein FliO n=1 Tax=Microbacterium sp. EST19A TaxID=2862681 RepID=UPI001CC00B24|nr:flagellar biosynthetic protein FliO [Microbacterium sp. EST19A]
MDDVLVALRMIVALAAVLGLLLFLSRRLQKAGAKGDSPMSGLLPKSLGRISGLRRSHATPGRGTKARPEKITVVARSGIGAKAQLVVAEFGGIRYVLGVTEHGISVVDTQEAPLTEEDEAVDEADEAGHATDDGSSTGDLDIFDDAECPLKSVA